MKKGSAMLKVAALCVLALGSVVAAVHTAPAHAQSRPLDAPRASGAVGERYDGYAVVRDAKASADVRKLVEDANARRREVYEQKAKEQGAPAEEVGKVYAKEILAKAPAGTYFQGVDGSWTQK